MKQATMLFLVLFTAIPLVAQSPAATEIPYIEVTESADIEVEPDEMRLSVTIAGYKDETNQETVDLDVTEARFMKILSEAGVKKSDVVLQNASTQGYWYYWWIYDRDLDPRVTKQFEVVFSEYRKLNQVLSELPGPKEGFVQVSISALKNKKISEYRKETKIEAIKAAKDKARYLLESIGNTPGKLIQVIELDEDDYGWYRPQGISNVISQRSLNGGQNVGDDSDPSVQKIKLRYRIKARFEIL